MKGNHKITAYRPPVFKTHDVPHIRFPQRNMGVPLILKATAPYSTEARALHGNFRLQETFDVLGAWTLDFWLFYYWNENQTIFRAGNPGEYIALSVQNREPYLNDEPVFKEMLSDYLISGGKFGKIFDSASSGLSLNTRFLAIEMEDLMNRREGCIVPALVYLFNLVEKKFDGRLSLLVLDEAWLFLKNETFSEKIAEWLKVLRKKNVFVVFATQDVADVEKSPLKTTIIQQCLTKLYLADPSARTEGMMEVYRAFGLSDSEIALIASSRMKRDYFYTSPLGRRLFQLDLGPLTLALIGAPDHKLLDALINERGRGCPLCADILTRKGIDYAPYLGHDAPVDKIPEKKETERIPAFVSPETVYEPSTREGSPRLAASDILDAASSIGERGKKGSGRAAELVAGRLGVSPATVYLARKILLHGGPELIEQVRRGELSLKKANKLLLTRAG